eukprot:GHRR01000174.1.p1 GENE.GHRR01000174.1~~GHRR01000174.1.p1  ORF type:complete len:138 (+),score=33.30 GHRR01000174.1:236-649(+)
MAATRIVSIMVLCSALLLTAACGVSATRPAALSTMRQRQLLQDKTQECIDAFNSAGGTSGIQSRVPACDQNNFKFQECCDQAKSTLQAGPPGCLCDEQVWLQVEQQMTSSGIQGLNADTLKSFTQSCGIPNFGAGTC